MHQTRLVHVLQRVQYGMQNVQQFLLRQRAPGLDILGKEGPFAGVGHHVARTVGAQVCAHLDQTGMIDRRQRAGPGQEAAHAEVEGLCGLRPHLAALLA